MKLKFVDIEFPEREIFNYEILEQISKYSEFATGSSLGSILDSSHKLLVRSGAHSRRWISSLSGHQNMLEKLFSRLKKQEAIP